MEAFIAELQSVVNELRSQAKELADRSCRDESDLVKIRANIYEVCATVAGVVSRTQPADRQDGVYLNKLGELPRNWRVALQAARDHGNTQRAHAEEIKLEALADVLARYQARKEC